MSDHTSTLQPKIQRLRTSMANLNGEERAQALLKIIHQPGWTTPQEAALVEAMLEHLTAQVDAVAAAHTTLMSVASKIGQ